MATKKSARRTPAFKVQMSGVQGGCIDMSVISPRILGSLVNEFAVFYSPSWPLTARRWGG